MVFNRIRSLINPFHKLNKQNKRSQVAVVITFTVAIIILLALVVINIYRLSFIKTLTSQTADKYALQVASQLGSMSAEMKENEQCDWNWGLIIFFCGAIIAILAPYAIPALAGLLGIVGLGVSIYGMVLANSSSAALSSIISKNQYDLGTLNGLRESALFAALSSIQTDDILLRSQGSGSGIFYDDTNNSKTCDSGEPVYDLSGVEEYRFQNQVGRYMAWYYTKRTSLLGGEIVRKKVADIMEVFKRYIDFYNWDDDLWKYNNAALVVEPAEGALSGSLNIDDIGKQLLVTCRTFTGVNACPGWIKDNADRLSNRVTILSIDEDDKDGDGNYNPSGFISDKFLQLAKMLEEQNYDPFFCYTSFAGFGGIHCPQIQDTRDDLLKFVGLVKYLMDLPISQRVQSVDQWMPLLYDVDFDHSTHPEGGDHDIFDRLVRDAYWIGEWIMGESIDTNRMIQEDGDTPIDEMVNNNAISHHSTCCREGESADLDADRDHYDEAEGCRDCYTDIDWNVCHCSWQDTDADPETPDVWVCDGENCITLLPGRFRGYYGTCTGADGNEGITHRYHPVCRTAATIDEMSGIYSGKRGDLYNNKPPWCTDLRGERCVSSGDGGDCQDCSRPGNSTYWHKSFYFQGRLSWRDPDYTVRSGFTEIRQAAEVLGALKHDLDELKWEIEQFALAIQPYLNVGDAFKEQVVYAWKGRDGRSHLVRVRMEDYPTELPALKKHDNWLGFENCLRVKDGTGQFKLNLWRYDEGRSVAPWWDFRYTQPREEVNYLSDISNLNSIISTIHNNWALPILDYKNSMLALFTSSELSNVCSSAVNSWTRAAYGTERKCIKILCTDGEKCPELTTCPDREAECPPACP